MSLNATAPFSHCINYLVSDSTCHFTPHERWTPFLSSRHPDPSDTQFINSTLFYSQYHSNSQRGKQYLCLLRHYFAFFQFKLLIDNISVFVDQSATQTYQEINKWEIFEFFKVQKCFSALPFDNLDNTSRQLASHHSVSWLLHHIILEATFKEVLSLSLVSFFF
jgi:hypothetical protein